MIRPVFCVQWARRAFIEFGALALMLTAVTPTTAAAQVPTTSTAQELLRTRKDLVAQLQTRLQTSGMSRDQLRARLRALGYPETLLDPYLQDIVPDSIAASTPDDVFRAVTALGLGTEMRPAAVAVPPPPRTAALDSTGNRGIPTADAGAALSVFGADVFRRNSSQFEPTEAGAADINYRVGPADVLLLIITGDVERAYSLEVTREGFVVIPQVGQVVVANLTVAQITNVLFARLGTQYSGVSRAPNARTKFTVSVARVRSNQVFVIGDVNAPGSYQVSGLGTMLTALYAAGGPTEAGSMRAVQLRRGTQIVSTLDVYDYLLRGDAANDDRLETGDIVFVPFHAKRVTLSGAVGRPAIYEMSDGETLADLIGFAGGFSATASAERIQVTRVVPTNVQREPGRDRVVIDVRTDSVRRGAVPPFPVEDDDSVHVYSIGDRVRNRITVTGSVWVPGPQALVRGTRLSTALAAAGGVRPDAYVGEILISRRMPDESKVQLRARLGDTSGAVLDDLVLQEDDEIRVFSREDFRPAQFVAVTGMVQKPGRYEFRDGITMRDLIQLAGGLNVGAFLGYAELARLPEDRAGGRLATTTRVPLDSSYLFDRPSRAASELRTNRAADVPLQPYDNVLVLREPDWTLLKTVSLTGEVRYPGIYALETKNDRIADLIRRAGGLTSEGYPGGAVFTRRLDQTGRVDIDLDRALDDVNSADNLRLEEGDSLFVPSYVPTVKVSGAVNSPTSVSFRSGKNLKYYLASAGGGARDADTHRAYVTQPDGSVEVYKHRLWLIPDHVPQPRPGAMVHVPTRDRTQVDRERLYGSIAQVVASLAAIVIVAVKQ